MERTEILKIIRTILVSILEHDNFEMNDTLSAAQVDGWDSLSHIMIITEIEKQFSIRFKLRELNELDNLGSLIKLVTQKHNEK